jgi:hypothetical protein
VTVRPHAAAVRKSLVDIPNGTVRDTLEMICDMLPQLGHVAYEQHRPEAAVASALQHAADVAVAAYLNGEVTPPLAAELEDWYSTLVLHMRDLAYATALVDRLEDADSASGPQRSSKTAGPAATRRSCSLR